ncbi:hypothetical protein [Porphyromonas catoniae]|nr:hypothetical protein [Porphyromonas catoniae]
MSRMSYKEDVYIPMEELYRVDTGYRMSGGFNLSIQGLTAGATVPPLAPVSVDKTTRTATLLKRVRVLEAGSAAKTLKVSKFSQVTAGTFLSNGTATLTVDSVDTSDKDFDLITAKADTSAFTLGAILYEATDASANKSKGVADYLIYAPTKVEEGATITALARAFEVQTSKLYIPLTEDDKKSLTDRFIFV